MQKEFDLVLCANGLIYKAPYCSRLTKGTEVIVENSSGMGEISTKIDCTYSIDPELDEECLNFILRITKTMTPLKKVLRKVKEIKLDYDDEFFDEEEKTDDHL